MDESADARRILTAVPQSDWKRPAGLARTSWLTTMKNEQPIIHQPQCGRCHRAGTGQTALGVIGSKWSYALNWCKLNNDDDDYNC